MMMKKKITKSKSCKSEVDDVRKVRAAIAVVQQQYKTTTKRKRDEESSTKSPDDDNSLRVLQTPPPPPPIAAAAAVETRRKQLVQVERLGGLKLRFRFSDNIHSSSSGGDHIPPPPAAVAVVKTTKNLAVQEIISSTSNDDHERNRCTVRRQIKLEKEREAARSSKINIHSSSKSTGDIPPVHVVQTNKLAVQEIFISTADEERNRCTMRSWRQMKVQREREAARRKMESITKTVDIPDNYYDTMLTLHQMFGRTQWVREAFSGVHNPKPLQKLGLFLKP